jgi:hypothetical protein
MYTEFWSKNLKERGHSEDLGVDTYSLTPWCRTLFEKPIVTQLVKKYPALFTMEPEGS